MSKGQKKAPGRPALGDEKKERIYVGVEKRIIKAHGGEEKIKQFMYNQAKELADKNICNYCGKSEYLEPINKTTVCHNCDNEF